MITSHRNLKSSLPEITLESLLSPKSIELTRKNCWNREESVMLDGSRREPDGTNCRVTSDSSMEFHRKMTRLLPQSQLWRRACQVDTKLSDFSRPVITIVTSRCSVMG